MAWDSGTYRRDASKANRGKPFEDFINFANEKYQAKGIAVMHKVPAEFIPLRGAHGQVASCKVDRKSCVDYLGRFRDIPVAVEAKHTQGARIDFSAVQDHQAEYLDAWMEGEGRQLAFVAVSFGMNRFLWCRGASGKQLAIVGRDTRKQSKKKLPLCSSMGGPGRHRERPAQRQKICFQTGKLIQAVFMASSTCK